MSRFFPFALLFIFFGQFSYASGIKIEGKIKGAIQEIYLYPDASFGEFEKQVIPIFQQGIFSLNLDITYPQLARLSVGGLYLTIYLSPGNNIVFNIDAMIFPQGIRYSGPGGVDNYLLQKYYQIEPPVREFDKQYYRILGHQFPFTTQVVGFMSLYSADDFKKRLGSKHQQMSQLFEDVQFASATVDFQRFLRSEVAGFLQYNLLAYTLLYAKREAIDLNYFQLSSLASGDINSNYYRNYLILYNLYTASITDGNNPRPQTCYRLAQNEEQDLPLAYLLSEIIISAVLKGDEETLMLFEAYLSEFPNSPFLRKIDKVIYKGNALFHGIKAPNFNLKTEDGGYISLEQFADKVVHIDFWATWCKPCLEKLDKLEKEKQKGASSDIVFITISIDNQESTWKNTIANRGYSGVHLFAGKSNTVVKDYKVSGIPSEFIVKKDGLFSPSPEDSTPSNLILLLNRLNGISTSPISVKK